jgi:cobalt/nickel transport system permease protein
LAVENLTRGTCLASHPVVDLALSWPGVGTIPAIRANLALVHIPDGYLSPTTCAALYGMATPFWAVALRRVRRLLATRLIPLVSLLAAFSFTIMMFNVPLPGGTTGHAVGVGVASVVLGPWASILAISVALLIQALLFGDGGITTFGANAFNMAVVGSLVAYGVYRLLSGRAAITARRRVAAAAAAGYAAINAAALCAAIEFGIQPSLFKDSAGAPLYAPYPLRIAVPAMMIGHLTFAGFAELVVSAGVVAYLQRADASLLAFTAPGAAIAEAAPDGTPTLSRRRGALRWLWATLALLIILTPLGLIATGAAWGEWRPQEFSDPAGRARIAAASGDQTPPAIPPRGLERWWSVWNAPLPGYTPRTLRNRSLGYMLSAMAGAGLVGLVSLLGVWLAGRAKPDEYRP